MAFQKGDQVSFTYNGKQYVGEITDEQGGTYVVLYKGIFPKQFRTDPAVKIIKSDLALANGDLAVVDGDMALTGEAAVQCKSWDVRASS